MEEPSTSTGKGSAATNRQCVNTLDRNFEETVSRWLEESDDSDCDDNPEETEPIVSDHDTLSEQSATENYSDESSESSDPSDDQRRSNYVYGKNQYKWAKAPPTRAVRTPRHNIIMKFPSTTLTTGAPKDPFSLWHLYFDDEVLDHILLWTNAKIDCVRQKYSDKSKAELQNLDLDELLAFLGLLIYSSVFKSNHENVNYIFATDGSGREIFKCVMSRNRFLMLLNCLRFDDFRTRKERLKVDKMAAASFLFRKIVENSQKYFNLGTCATVDEQLVSFRGKCSFVVYMPKKPGKYGL
jgi:hypothetical protein